MATKEDVLELINALPGNERIALREALEEMWSVKLQEPQPMTASAYGCAPNLDYVEQHTFDVVLVRVSNRIKTIKLIRALNPELTLMDVTIIVDEVTKGTHRTIAENASRQEAHDLRDFFAVAGARVELR